MLMSLLPKVVIIVDSIITGALGSMLTTILL
jgi:hypothetical protein